MDKQKIRGEETCHLDVIIIYITKDWFSTLYLQFQS